MLIGIYLIFGYWGLDMIILFPHGHFDLWFQRIKIDLSLLARLFDSDRPSQCLPKQRIGDLFKTRIFQNRNCFGKLFMEKPIISMLTNPTV